MTDDTCGVCRYWKADEPAEGVGTPALGACRRYPPQVYVAQQVSQVGQQPVVAPNAKPTPPHMVISAVGLMATFPTMETSGYCGEFSRDARTVQ